VAPERVVKLPAADVLPFEHLSPHAEVQEIRAATLWKIATGAASIVIAPVEAAAQKLFRPEYYADLARRIKRGEEHDLDELTSHLASVGYDAVDLVEMPGQFTRRGGILDVYSPEAERPVRLEFFGDEVESLRRFDAETQRSLQPLDEAVLLPLTETPVTEQLLAAVHARLTGSHLDEGLVDTELRERVAVASAGGVTVFPGWELFAGVAGADATLLSLFKRSVLFVEEPGMLHNHLERWWNKLEQRHERSNIGSLIEPRDLFRETDLLLALISNQPGLDLDQLGIVDVLDDDTTLGEIAFATRPTLRFHGNSVALVENIKSLMEQEQRVVIAAANQGELERTADLLGEYQVPYRIGWRSEQADSELGQNERKARKGEKQAPVLVRAPIANGVALSDAGIVIIGVTDVSDDADVTARPATKRAKGSLTSAFVSDFRDLTVNDYVVHVEHGIARYVGLREIEQDGVNVEFMILEFAEAARLYVPLTRLDLIQKYRSSEGGPAPVLNKLGSQNWAKTKARVRKAMEDMTEELLKLYAQRKAARGHQFTPDNEFQREFEDAFDFTETDDQLSAIKDIKADMESELPMDRLLCGDVGYGKTEVAMRAAFKAVQDGKQVAVLTPTTVLSFQHFETFKKRFRQFPVTIEMISRFRTAKEQKKILEDVEAGKVDILIGTHRVLSKDLKFQDIGLLIVDEEQRFGVRHKERLKQIRAQIDVLTMSATPIPRTLHMSLVGLRDMSVIETPPKDRMAIQTVVAKFDEKLVRSAVELELERGGQVYFVYNRVESIYEIAAKVRELVPTARVIVGHGQMSEGELEKVIFAFMNHEYDVLVATTIIENGIDIPLANTIIINRADRHGLSELYQLRGRVGRSNRRSYAYLLIPPEQELTDVARRRLAALKEFSDLGAGFKIAALDLELRGAGNMLGGQQSGHIEAIGFEMYTGMLEEAVSRMKGEAAAETINTQLNLGISLRIDESYIPEENQRLRIYKRIAAAASEQAVQDVQVELEDRYGPLPDGVKHLLEAAQLRAECERLGVAQVDRKRDQVHLRFGAEAQIDPGRLMKLVAKNVKRGAQFTPQGVLRFPLSSKDPVEMILEIRLLLDELAAEPSAA
jgi:transcription-repair coupling factor (superfamily II helicase)